MQNWLFYAEQNEMKQYLYQIKLTIFFHISPPKKKMACVRCSVCESCAALTHLDQIYSPICAQVVASLRQWESMMAIYRKPLL